MKKIIALIMAAAMLLALAACTAPEQTTDFETNIETIIDTTTETTAETAAETETEEVTETEEITTEEITEAPTETEAVTEAATEAEEEDGNVYKFSGIIVTLPEGWSVSGDMSGVPTASKNGDMSSIFNFQATPAENPFKTQDDAVNYLNSMPGLGKGTFQFKYFKTYEVDGITVVRYDYTWILEAVVVKVHFADYTVLIMYAGDSGHLAEFDSVINSMRIGY